MKTILPLIAFLTLISSANAGLTILTPNGTTVAPGATLVVGIGTDSTDVDTAQTMALVTAGGTISIETDADFNPVAGIVLNPPMDGDQVIGSIFNDAVENGITGLPAGTNGIGATIGFDGGLIAANMPIFANIKFTSRTPGQIVVKLAILDDNFGYTGTNYATTTINVISDQNSNPEPNQTPPPSPTRAPDPHGAVLVYKVSANLKGYNFNSASNPRTIRPYNYNFTGYMVADINTSTLCTNYPAQPDANSPTFIITSGKSFTAFSRSEPNITSQFDLVQAGAAYFQKFEVLAANGRSSHKSLVMPQFEFIYSRAAGSAVAFYDNHLIGNIASTDIGIGTKANIAPAIIGDADFEFGPAYKVSGNLILTLDSNYTKAANRSDMRVVNTVDMITAALIQKRYNFVSLKSFFP
jgi:hypothetical protein